MSRLHLLPLLMLTLLPTVMASTVIDAGFAFQSQAGGGDITWAFTVTVSTWQVADSFATFYNPLTEYTAIGLDTPAGVNLQVTRMEAYDLTYTTSGAAANRLYLPRSGIPTVTGGTLVWDSATSIATVTTTGAATVNLHWAITSGSIYTSLTTLWQLIPFLIIIAALGAAKYPEYWRQIVVLIFVLTVMGYLSYLYQSWGF